MAVCCQCQVVNVKLSSFQTPMHPHTHTVIRRQFLHIMHYMSLLLCTIALLWYARPVYQCVLAFHGYRKSHSTIYTYLQGQPSLAANLQVLQGCQPPPTQPSLAQQLQQQAPPEVQASRRQTTWEVPRALALETMINARILGSGCCVLTWWLWRQSIWVGGSRSTIRVSESWLLITTRSGYVCLCRVCFAYACVFMCVRIYIRVCVYIYIHTCI